MNDFAVNSLGMLFLGFTLATWCVPRMVGSGPGRWLSLIVGLIDPHRTPGYLAQM